MEPPYVGCYAVHGEGARRPREGVAADMSPLHFSFGPHGRMRLRRFKNEPTHIGCCTKGRRGNGSATGQFLILLAHSIRRGLARQVCPNGATSFSPAVAWSELTWVIEPKTPSIPTVTVSDLQPRFSL